MNPVTDKLTYAIIPGIGEGQLIARRMRLALRAAGLTEAHPSQADVLVTHSGGVYVMPRDGQATYFVHINVTHCMPYRQLLAAHRRKVRYDLHARWQRGGMTQLARGILAGLANVYYLTNLQRGLQMRRGFLRSSDFLATLPAGSHLFICGINDGLSDATAVMKEAGSGHAFLSIKAGHDDCWRDPQPYVKAILTHCATHSPQKD